MIFALAVLPGCASSAEGPDAADEETVTEDNGEVDKSDWTGLGGKSSKNKDKNKDKNKKKNDKPEKIDFSYQYHPVSLDDGDNHMASGRYVTIDIEEDERDTYPELAAALEEYNINCADNLTSYLSGCEEEIRELRSEGMPNGYEEDYDLYPQRADEKVFSFVVGNFSYMGGAHGIMGYKAYNFDPATAKEIGFADVVGDTEGLPGIIFDELVKQNEDLTEYFEVAQGDKESLINELTVKLDNDAKDLVWAVTYEGIHIFFEDYAMGSYAAGSRDVVIRFADHPGVFTGKYDDYSDAKKVPNIDTIANKRDDADTIMLRTKGASAPAGETKPHEEQNRGEKITLSKDQQRRLNLFISNFVEQGFDDYEDTGDVHRLAQFAYRWSRINRPADVEVEGNYYRISLDTIQRVVKKYFGVKITERDLDAYDWAGIKDEEHFYQDGYYYNPAADGETYSSFAIVNYVSDNKDGTWTVNFKRYILDIEAYWDNNESVPKKYYAMTDAEAESDINADADYSGVATVRREGSSYTLVSYHIY